MASKNAELLEAPEVRSETTEQSGIPDRYVVSEPEVMSVKSLDDGIVFLGERPVTLNHVVAREFFDKPEFEGERPFQPDHAQYLMGTMKQGLFRGESVEIIECFCESTKKTYRLNGKHTCAAVMNMPKKFSIKNVKFLRYSAKNEEFMRVLYSTIDNGAPRTQAHMLVALLAGTPDFKHFNQITIRSLGEAVAFWEWPKSHDRKKHKANDRARLLTGKYQNLSLLIGEFLQQETGHRSDHMQRSPVQTAMFATYNIAIKGKKGAVEFWGRVRDGANLKRGDPRLLLRDNLMKSVLTVRTPGAEQMKRVGREEMFRWCCNAWIAWREGRDLFTLKTSLGPNRPKLF